MDEFPRKKFRRTAAKAAVTGSSVGGETEARRYHEYDVNKVTYVGGLGASGGRRLRTEASAGMYAGEKKRDRTGRDRGTINRVVQGK